MPRRQANRNKDEVHRGRFAGTAREIGHARGRVFTTGRLLPPFVPGAARASEPRSEPEHSLVSHLDIYPTHIPARLRPAVGAPRPKFPAMRLTRRTQSALTIAVSS